MGGRGVRVIARAARLDLSSRAASQCVSLAGPAIILAMSTTGKLGQSAIADEGLESLALPMATGCVAGNVQER